MENKCKKRSSIKKLTNFEVYNNIIIQQWNKTFIHSIKIFNYLANNDKKIGPDEIKSIETYILISDTVVCHIWECKPIFGFYIID